MKQMTGAEALMEVYLKEGVEYVFGIHGATEVYFMDALENTPQIKYMLGLHEVVCAGMGEGYARASGKVGVLNLHTNTGLAAALPLLGNAHTGGVPLVVTVGQQDTRLMAQEPALTGDLIRIAGPFCKWATEITHPEDIPMIMHRAFKVAKQTPSGPVVVSLPLNVMSAVADFEYEKGADLFTGLCPDPAAIDAAVAILSSASSPVLFVEEGITRSDALKEIVDLAETCGAPVYQHWMADVNFPVHHPLYMGDLDLYSPKTRDLFQAADVLIVVGASFFALPTHLPKAMVPPSTKVIQIDDNPWQLAKNFPVACGIEGNIKVSLKALTLALKKNLSGKAMEAIAQRSAETAAVTLKKREALLADCLKEKDAVPISPSRLMTEIRDTLPPGSRIVDDCWTSSGLLRHILDLKEPLAYQRPRQGGASDTAFPEPWGPNWDLPQRRPWWPWWGTEAPCGPSRASGPPPTMTFRSPSLSLPIRATRWSGRRSALSWGI